MSHLSGQVVPIIVDRVSTLCPSPVASACPGRAWGAPHPAARRSAGADRLVLTGWCLHGRYRRVAPLHRIIQVDAPDAPATCTVPPDGNCPSKPPEAVLLAPVS